VSWALAQFGIGSTRWRCARDCERCGHSRRVYRNSQVTDKAAWLIEAHLLRVSEKLDARAAASGVAPNAKISALVSRSEDSALRSIAALPLSTEEAELPLAPQSSGNFRHSHQVVPAVFWQQRSVPEISDLIDDKVGRDSHEEDRTRDRRLDASADALTPEGRWQTRVALGVDNKE
jgi:hypothetical protein